MEHEINLDVLFAQRGLIEGTTVRAFSIANGGSAYVYVADGAARDEALAVARELGDRVRIVERDEIAKLGGDPEAAFAVAASPGFEFGLKRTGPAIVDTPGRGSHGAPPTEPSMQASFLAIGGRVTPRDLGTIRMIDIAPTVARWLGVSLPAATGTAHTL